MKKRRFHFLLLPLLFTLFLFPATVRAEDANTILNGVHISGLDVSGMTEEEANAALEQFIMDGLSSQAHFHIQGDTFTTSLQSLGYAYSNVDAVAEAVSYGKVGNIVSKYKIRKDLEQAPHVISLESTVNSSLVEQILDANCTVHDQPVKNMTVAHENGTFRVVEGEAGHVLNLGASTHAIVQYYTNEWQGGDADFDLIEEYQEPAGDAAELAKIQDVLGEASTSYASSNSNRRQNIENGASKIVGTVLYPGESLSMLNKVMPFDENNGYAAAGSYLNGQVIQTYGGGVCQVSTTLYLAVMRAELQVDKRYSHSMKVSYVKPSMDAAIAEGSKDFIFTNNTEAPIYIEGYADSGTIAFFIYGQEYRDPNRTVSYESETIESNDSAVDFEAVLWKVVTENGEETRTQYNQSTYYKSGRQED